MMDYNGTEYRPGNAGYAPLPPYAPDEEFKSWYGQRDNQDEIDFVWESTENQRKEG